jgi:uncharacterized protein YjdB
MSGTDMKHGKPGIIDKGIAAAADAAHKVAEVAVDATDKAEELAHNVTGKVKEVAAGAAHITGDAVHGVAAKLGKAGDKLEKTGK